MDIEQTYNHIPDTSSLAIRTSGLLGEQYLALNIGFDDPEMGTSILKDGGVIQDTKSAIVLEDLIGQFLYKSGSGDNNTAGADKTNGADNGNGSGQTNGADNGSGSGTGQTNGSDGGNGSGQTNGANSNNGSGAGQTNGADNGSGSGAGQSRSNGGAVAQ